MNIKKISIIVAAIVVLLVGFGLLMAILNAPIEVNVKFTSSYPDTKITLKVPKSKDVEIKGGQTIKLSVGDYWASYSNTDLSKNPFLISIKKTTNDIRLDPGYSAEILDKKMSDEKDSIENKIISIFSSSTYSIETEKLYHIGEWFSGSLTVTQTDPNADPLLGNPDDYDRYYIVFHKDSQNNTWTLVGGPKLILTKPENPTIPIYVLDDINPSS